ncbi:MAG: VWA domain-containing protein [Candidatus Caenarcaniphilales bacterium]|jgi:Ca-activated chloride channel family protein|nr:VWA domain-containing protein [Candidatus Caenarcaniphilales bacterium]
MNIKHPELLFLLFLIPGFIAFALFIWKRRASALNKLCDLSKLRSLFPKGSQTRYLIHLFLISLSFLMFIIALISPRWGFDLVEVKSEGTNILIALDVSKSMEARDIQPSRLARAKLEINKLIDKLSGDRIGLIVFAGDAYLQTPLTHDYLMVKDWLSGINTDSIDIPGTSIKSAIERATKAFDHLKSESKALIIISDGEEQDKQTLMAASQAAGQGIKIYCIGVGTESGAPVQTIEGIKITKLDDEMLRNIAQNSGGVYVRSSNNDFHLDQIYFDSIKTEISQEELKSGKSKKWFETYQIFMSIALAALFLDLLLMLNFGIKLPFRALILFTFLANAQASEAHIFDWRLWDGDFKLQAKKYQEAVDRYAPVLSDQPSNTRLNYNLGVANYKIHDYKKAANNFMHAIELADKNPDLKEKALYNLGNAFFRQENYQSAIDSYEQALKIKANDENAKYNLGLAKKKLEEQKKNKNKGNDKNNQDQQNQKDNSQNKNQDNSNKNDKQNQNNKQQNSKNQSDQSQGQSKTGLSKQDIDRLLRQAKESNPASMQKSGSKNLPSKNLKPW